MNPTLYVSQASFEIIIYGTITLLGCTVVMLVALFIRELRNKTLW